MRLFLAIDLPKKQKQNLSSQLQTLKRQYGDIKWVSSENYHITLQFFGNDYPEDSIRENLMKIVYDIPTFHLYFSHADLFLREKITIYLTFTRNKILEKLVGEIKKSFQIDSRSKFVPHLSIGRWRIPSKQQYFLLKKKLKNLNVDISFKVTAITLFDSIITGQKPLYKKIVSFPLYR